MTLIVNAADRALSSALAATERQGRRPPTGKGLYNLKRTYFLGQIQARLAVALTRPSKV